MKNNDTQILVGLCDHCGKIEHNKFKTECPDGFALFWTKLEGKELKQKTVEFKKLEVRYKLEQAKQLK